jgi:uncharacterized protein YcbX
MLLKVHRDDSSPSKRWLENMHIGAGFPEMGLFTAHLDVEKESLRVGYTPPTDSNSPGDSLEVPLKPELKGLEKIQVVMHNSLTSAYDMGSKCNSWFTTYFGFEVVFAYLGANRRPVLGNMSPKAAAQGIEVKAPLSSDKFQILKQLTPSHRVLAGLVLAPLAFWGILRFSLLNARVSTWLEQQVKRLNTSGGKWLTVVAPTFATASLTLIGYLASSTSKSANDEGITFADVAPYLVVTTTSLDDVSSLLPAEETMDIRKFRPNVIIADAPVAWEEDYWDKLRVSANPGSEIDFVLTQNCARCQSINVDFATGKPGTTEAGSVLKKLMKDRRVDKGTKYSPVFGRYGFVTKSSEGALIKVGDEVKVAKRNAERTTFGKSLVPAELSFHY